MRLKKETACGHVKLGRVPCYAAERQESKKEKRRTEMGYAIYGARIKESRMLTRSGFFYPIFITSLFAFFKKYRQKS